MTDAYASRYRVTGPGVSCHFELPVRCQSQIDRVDRSIAVSTTRLGTHLRGRGIACLAHYIVAYKHHTCRGLRTARTSTSRFALGYLSTRLVESWTARRHTILRQSCFAIGDTCVEAKVSPHDLFFSWRWQERADCSHRLRTIGALLVTPPHRGALRRARNDALRRNVELILIPQPRTAMP